jgi:hypothetical protein
MTETKETPKDMLGQWMQWQQDFWSEWSKNQGKAMEGLMAGWPKVEGANWITDFYQNWLKSFRGMFGGDGAPVQGLGPDAFGKVLDAEKVYTDLLSFWTRAMTPLSKLPAGTELSVEKIKEARELWNNEYQKMMESLWGAMPSPELRDTAKAITSATTVAGDYVWNFLEPVLKNLEGLPAILDKVAKGESGALMELSGLFRKNYESTMGKALRAPTMGYFRESVDLMGKAMDAYIQFGAAMNEFMSLFYSTGQKAAEKVFSRLNEFQGKEATPENFREFYKLWWTINEDTYHDLFMTKEFTGMLREVLRRGLLFRKWLDDFTDSILKLTNLPTKKDMDEIYHAIYDLRKEVRWQARAIREIEQHLGIEVKKPAISDEGTAREHAATHHQYEEEG